MKGRTSLPLRSLSTKVVGSFGEKKGHRGFLGAISGAFVNGGY